MRPRDRKMKAQLKRNLKNLNIMKNSNQDKDSLKCWGNKIKRMKGRTHINSKIVDKDNKKRKSLKKMIRLWQD